MTFEARNLGIVKSTCLAQQGCPCLRLASKLPNQSWSTRNFKHLKLRPSWSSITRFVSASCFVSDTWREKALQSPGVLVLLGEQEPAPLFSHAFPPSYIRHLPPNSQVHFCEVYFKRVPHKHCSRHCPVPLKPDDATSSFLQQLTSGTFYTYSEIFFNAQKSRLIKTSIYMLS